MGIKVKFIQDINTDDIEIVIKAKDKNAEVERILNLLDTNTENSIVCDMVLNEDIVDTDDIIIISKVGRYLSVKTVNNEYIVSQPLYKIEEELDKNWFVKISQSEIVNLRYVKKWSFDGGGIIKIELENNLYSYTSRRYAVVIQEILKKGGKQKWKEQFCEELYWDS